MESDEKSHVNIGITKFISDDMSVKEVDEMNDKSKSEVNHVHRESCEGTSTVKIHTKNVEIRYKKELYCMLESNNFRCNVCTKALPEEHLMLEHIKTHKRNSHMCKICGRGYYRPGDLTRHTNKEHNKEAKPSASHGETAFVCESCNVCGKTFLSQKALRVHMRVHSFKHYACKMCHNKFLNKFCLDEHIKTHTGERPFKCDICKKRCINASSLKIHKLKHSSDRPLECKKCHKKFKYKTTLQKHMYVHLGRNQQPGKREQPVKCDECGVKFAHKSSLKRHKTLHLGEKPFQCSYCEKKYSVKHALTCHVKEKHELQYVLLKSVSQITDMQELKSRNSIAKPEQIVEDGSGNVNIQDEGNPSNLTPAKCHRRLIQNVNAEQKFYKANDTPKFNATMANDECSSKDTISKSGSLGLACKDVTLNQDHVIEHVCNTCKKVYPSANSLKIHSKIHTEKHYVCTVCKRKFPNNFSMERHKRLHIEEKSHENIGSHIKHNTILGLKLPMAQHSGEGSYKCEICSCSFPRFALFKIHKLRHTGEKPSKCDICGRMFLKKQLLEKHMTQHSGGKTHHCSLCGESFLLHSALKSHNKSNHERELPHSSTSNQDNNMQEIKFENHDPLAYLHGISNEHVIKVEKGTGFQ